MEETERMGPQGLTDSTSQRRAQASIPARRSGAPGPCRWRRAYQADEEACSASTLRGHRCAAQTRSRTTSSGASSPPAASSTRASAAARSRPPEHSTTCTVPYASARKAVVRRRRCRRSSSLTSLLPLLPPRRLRFSKKRRTAAASTAGKEGGEGGGSATPTGPKGEGAAVCADCSLATQTDRRGSYPARVTHITALSNTTLS